MFTAYLLVIVATTQTAFGGSAGSMQARGGTLDACSLLTAVEVRGARIRRHRS